MQITSSSPNKQNQRITAYRSRLKNQGVKRVELRIPIQDIPLLHTIANTLRSGGEEACSLREQMSHAAGEEKSTTGKDLIAFFRNSPLKDVVLDLDRDSAVSRTIPF